MSAYFVTGTGTGVGKTFTSCALLHASGGAARGYKPIISGWDKTPATDTAQLIAVGGGAQTVDEVSPWRFWAPLSPHRAAAQEGTEIPFAALVEWSKARMAEATGLTLIEGVGGLMVPLDEQRTVLDWVVALGAPAIVVTGSYLGSINHTLMTLALLKQAGVPVAALVMNETAGSTVDFAEAQAGLMPFIETIGLRVFQPLVSSWADATVIHAMVGKL
ncbi:MAG: dethiobiotin synthase [Pseudomonadota bacterium]